MTPAARAFALLVHVGLLFAGIASGDPMPVVAALLVALGSMGWVLRPHLERRKEKHSAGAAVDAAELGVRIEQIREAVDGLARKHTPGATYDALKTIQEATQRELQRRGDRLAQAEAALTSTRAVWDETYHRLQNAVAEVSRRGNLSLTIGIVTTIVGVVVLISLWTAGAAPVEPTAGQWLAHYAPRAATAIAIEFMAVFFLRLYRSGLAEARYYQAQLSNLATQRAIAEFSLGTRDRQMQLAALALIGRFNSTATEPGDSNDLADLSKLTGELAVLVGKVKG